MGKRPSFQFYPGDWMKDPALSMCAPATRGIWVDLLCAIHELDHAGQVTGTPEQLSRLCRCSVAQFVDALSEIKLTRSADVSERNGIVTVTSRRMKRDSIEREKTNERVKKHRCNGVVTDSETQMKQHSSSSSSCTSFHSVHTKKAASAAKKEPPPLSVKNSEQSVPDDVLQLIDCLVSSRKDLGSEIRSVSGMKARLRQAWMDNPGEADLWRSELSENLERAEKAAAAANSQAKSIADRQEEDAKREAEQERGRAILRKFDQIPPVRKAIILLEAKRASGNENGPDTPWLYVREIGQILEGL